MLSPTRELAIQTEKEIQSLIKGSVPPFLRSSAASCALSETLRDLIPSIRLLVTSSLFSDESTPILIMNASAESACFDLHNTNYSADLRTPISHEVQLLFL